MEIWVFKHDFFQAMMDRERKDELPQMQVGFIDVICLPLYKVQKNYEINIKYFWMKYVDDSINQIPY